MKRFTLVVLLCTFAPSVFSAPPSCSANLLQNPAFSAGVNMIGNGSMPPSTVTGWVTAARDPQLVSAAGCGNPGYIAMWGNQVVGEAIRQKLSAPLVQGQTYKFSLCVRYANPSAAGPVRVRVRLSNGPATYGSTAGVSVVSPDITSKDWVTITLPYLKANAANLDTITINPENASAVNSGTAVSWAHIDNVCLERISLGDPIVTGTLGGTTYKVVPTDFAVCTLQDGVKVSDVDSILSANRRMCKGQWCFGGTTLCESAYFEKIWDGAKDTIFTAAQQTALLNAAETIAAEHVFMCGNERKEVMGIQFFTEYGTGGYPASIHVKVIYGLCGQPPPPH